jgi:hypothetical protein
MPVLRRQFEKRRAAARCLSLATTIYLFRCGESGLYAFTADPSGHVLPSRIYPQIRWRFERSVTVRPDRNSSKQRNASAILDAIAEHGFHLTHAAVNAEHCATLGLRALISS